VGSQRVDTVVVTGLHRSGTTFLGSLLSGPRGVSMLDREPLNVGYGFASADDWYPRLTDADRQGHGPNTRVCADLDRLVNGKPVRWTPRNAPPAAGLKARVRAAQRHALMAAAPVVHRTVVVKDPFLSLSLPYVSEYLTRRPILVAMRHPAGWTMSLRRMDWHPGRLLNRLQARGDLGPVRSSIGMPERDWTAADALTSAAWAWSLLTAAATTDAEALGPRRALLVPLETMTTDPARRAVELLDNVGLAADQRALRVITDLTEASEVVPSTQQTWVLQRDTRRSVDAWRTRLDAADQAAIWRICEPVAARYYEP
jgi:hypothetical protein